MTFQRRAAAVAVLSMAVTACGSPSPVLPDGSAGEHETGPSDSGSATDGASDGTCVPTQNPSICALIVRCEPCDGGMCGAIANLLGCDQEGATCRAEGNGLCGGQTCACSGRFWQCGRPVGIACPAVGAQCVRVQNYGGGGADSFTCCAGGADGGVATWQQGCN